MEEARVEGYLRDWGEGLWRDGVGGWEGAPVSTPEVSGGGEASPEEREREQEGGQWKTEKNPLLIEWEDRWPGSGRVRALFIFVFLWWAGPPGSRRSLMK